MRPDSFKFDWYSANINEFPKMVIDSVSHLGHRIVENRGIAFQYHRKNGYQVFDDNDTSVATVCFNDWDECETIAFSSSDAAMNFSSIVRDKWPEKHTVTRLDSSADFFGTSSYKKLAKIGLKVAKGHDLYYEIRGDLLHPEKGKTQYIGSGKSNFRTRLYEKGKHIISDSPEIKLMVKAGMKPSDISCFEGAHKIDDLTQWVRLELQARPDGAYARKIASTVTPEQAWFMTGWTSQLAKDALSLDLERLYVRLKKQPNNEKAIHHMAIQYASVLEQQVEAMGEWECLGLKLRDIIKEYRRLQRLGFH